MKKILTMMVAVACAMVFAVGESEAKRMGGGKSFGKQNSNVTQRDSAAPREAGAPPSGANTAPAVAPKAAAPNAAPGAAAAAQPARNRWLGPIAGLAAGLGLMALASHFGFGEGLANFMMIALLVLAVVFVVRMFLARRNSERPVTPGNYAYSGVGQEASVQGYSPLPPQPRQADVVRPALEGGASAGPAAAWRIPAEFDVDGFVHQAKVQFVRLQAAFDNNDVADLREFTSPEMFAELKLQIDERKGADNRTDVVTLEAELLGVESTAAQHMASVRFRGMLREEAGAAAAPFDEVWNFTKPADGSAGWVLGGIQQLN